MRILQSRAGGNWTTPTAMLSREKLRSWRKISALPFKLRANQRHHERPRRIWPDSNECNAPALANRGCGHTRWPCSALETDAPLSDDAYVGIQGKPVALPIALDSLQIAQSVTLVPKYLLPLIAPHYNVIQRSFELHSGFSGHRPSLLKNCHKVQTQALRGFCKLEV